MAQGRDRESQKEISQETAKELLAALKALMKIVTLTNGGAYTWDEYRNACMAVSKVEGNRT
jgi:hypothetical protein